MRSMRSSARCAGTSASSAANTISTCSTSSPCPISTWARWRTRASTSSTTNTCSPRPETATDADYAHIEAIIAHEYFHNWTGNRITCRDWFQLCLKEGLTVFRDQEFSSDERSRPVHRIAEVKTLRARQFSEDAGPLAHPVRPSAISRDQQLLHGDRLREGRRDRPHAQDDRRRRGFPARHGPLFRALRRHGRDGRGFPSAFADVTGRDLSHFARWYAQAGTPRVAATGAL